MPLPIPVPVNFGDLGPAAKALIERTADIIEGGNKAQRIVREAEASAKALRIEAAAKADCELVAATTQLEIEEMTARKRRAIARLISDADADQKNMEAIRDKSLPLLKDGAKPEDLEEDWTRNFFQKCRIVSDDEMQTLWAKILAGEANAKGSFSKRTVNTLGDLDKADADDFAKLCRFTWHSGLMVPMIFDAQAEIYTQTGVTFNTLSHLDDIGLISFNPISGFSINDAEAKGAFWYFGRLLIYELEVGGRRTIPIGHAIFTNIGKELAPLCEVKPLEGFFEYVMGIWQREGLNISEFIAPTSTKGDAEVAK